MLLASLCMIRRITHVCSCPVGTPTPTHTHTCTHKHTRSPPGHAGSISNYPAGCNTEGCRDPAAWDRMQCLNPGDREGASCSTNADCGTNGVCGSTWSACRQYFDRDRNSFDTAGNLVKFDFDFGEVTAGDTASAVVQFGDGRFTQHVMTTVDHPFVDVDNPFSAAGVDVRADHIHNSTWRTRSASVMSVFSAYGCDTGPANQPPRFVASFSDNPADPISTDFNANTEVTCHYSRPCVFRINATDFVMDAAGRDGARDDKACETLNRRAPCVSNDLIVIEPAFGREMFDTSELKKYMTSEPCEGTGQLSCEFVLKTEDNPADELFFEQTAIGKIYVQCFVAVDKHDPSSTTGKTCRSLPLCVKITMEGTPPKFVAPTPLAANSRDDLGKLVPRRTDVPACEGYPLNLPIVAEDDDKDDRVRVYIWDPDVDRDMYASRTGDLTYLPDGGTSNANFFSSRLITSPGVVQPDECGNFDGYGATKGAPASFLQSIDAMKSETLRTSPNLPVKSIVAGYKDSESNNATYTLKRQAVSVQYTLSALARNGMDFRTNTSCLNMMNTRGQALCREKLANMDQVRMPPVPPAYMCCFVSCLGWCVS
jgi:hypothetical protein